MNDERHGILPNLHESNADYIAAVIVSHGRLGQEAGMVPPEESPQQW